MPSRSLRCAIIGCGHIAQRYARNIASYEEVSLAGFYDLDPTRASVLSQSYGGKTYPDLDAVLQDKEVDLMVNLSIHHAHEEIITKCLHASKHVYTEKPLALSHAGAKQLVQLAKEKNLRLASAPINALGEAQKTAKLQIEKSDIGPIRLIYAEVNHGKIESWHANPEPFYQVGPLWDVGIYPLTLLCNWFGSISSVQAFSQTLLAERCSLSGKKFTTESPDLISAWLRFESGPIARLTANFYVSASRQAGSIEIHGDHGSVYLGDFQRFNAAVELSKKHRVFETVPLISPPPDEPPPEIEYGRGVQDLAQAILQNRPHHADAELAAHVIEAMETILLSGKTGRPEHLESRIKQKH